MENVIKNMNSSSEIINTTKNGAKIAGTTFMPLEEVIEKNSNELILQVKSGFKVSRMLIWNLYERGIII